jgi:hypothetical protein
VDTNLLALVDCCDGQRSLRGLLEDLATRLGRSVADIAPTCLEVVRRLIAQGFLVAAPEKSFSLL